MRGSLNPGMLGGAGGGGGGGVNWAAVVAMFGGSDAGGLWSADDLTKLFQSSAGSGVVSASNDPVGYMTDLSGKSGPQLQATAARKPLLSVSAGINRLDFDGADDLMRPASQIALAGTPFTVVLAFRPLSWTASDNLFGPHTGTATCYSYQSGSSPQVTMYHNGGGGTFASPFTVGADHVALFEFNGASSTVQKDSNAPVSMTTGTGAGNGITIGSDGASLSCGNIGVHAAMLISRLLTSGEKATVINRMGASQGRSL